MSPLAILIEKAVIEWRQQQAQKLADAPTVRACRTVAAKKERTWWERLAFWRTR